MKKAVTICLVLLVTGSIASASVVWNQEFDSDTSGWLDSTNGWYGSISQVASGGGTLGLTSAGGSGHAEVLQGGDLGDETGAFSRFDGYRDTWPGGMTASIDIYLDKSWGLGEGFDYAVAANGADDTHLRDFIFHVTMDTDTQKLLVAGSNNTNFAPREDLDTLNNYEVANSGWYTFEHVFRDFGDGSLAVDLNLRDSAGILLFTETRNNGSDTLGTVVGGNRYAWFTNVDIDGGIGVDNHALTIPEPATMVLLGLGGLLLRRKK